MHVLTCTYVIEEYFANSEMEVETDNECGQYLHLDVFNSLLLQAETGYQTNKENDNESSDGKMDEFEEEMDKFEEDMNANGKTQLNTKTKRIVKYNEIKKGYWKKRWLSQTIIMESYNTYTGHKCCIVHGDKCC